MRHSRRAVRNSGFAAAVLLAAYVVMAGGGTVATEVGDAGVTIGDDVARVVERVAYRQDVTRLGDVVVVEGEPVDPIEVPEVAAIWQIVDETWPESQRGSLVQLSVIAEGDRGLVGVVHPSALGGWILSLDSADVEDRHLIEETIVHELSHVVTLDRSVFRFGDGECSGVRIELGCAFAGSLLADFATAFWPDDEPVGPSGDFVNDYAMTSVHEDLAETFTSMVLGWTPAGDVIAAKVAMLEADPELAALAAELRAILG